MYSLSQLSRGLKTPSLFFREANRLYHRRLDTWEYNENGANILKEEWDTLVILDGCRYDVFGMCNEMVGETTSRISRGSNTVEFLRGNFGNRTIRDTVYVTANPQLYRHGSKINARFYDVVNVWDVGGWDEEYGTVLPETVTQYGIEALEEYDEKRVIIHYVQPHYPFIEAGTDFDKGHLDDEAEDLNPWDRIKQGLVDIDHDRVWDAYKRNLERCLPHVEELVASDSYKTVVTADHGNMFGDRSRPFPIREWGHPRGIYTKELVKVPWFVPPYEDRKEVTEEQVRERQVSGDSSEVKERLRDLGYR